MERVREKYRRTETKISVFLIREVKSVSEQIERGDFLIVSLQFHEIDICESSILV